MWGLGFGWIHEDPSLATAWPVRNRQCSIHCSLAVPSRFVPESEFKPVPQPELVVDNAQVVLDYMLRRTDGLCDFTVLQSLGNEFDDSEFSSVGSPITIALRKHNYLPYKPRGLRAGSRKKTTGTYCKSSLSWLGVGGQVEAPRCQNPS